MTTRIIFTIHFDIYYTCITVAGRIATLVTAIKEALSMAAAARSGGLIGAYKPIPVQTCEPVRRIKGWRLFNRLFCQLTFHALTVSESPIRIVNKIKILTSVVHV